MFKKLCFVLGVSLMLAGVASPYKALALENNKEYIVEKDTGADTEDAEVLKVGDSNVIASGKTKGKCNWSIDSNYGLTIKGGKGAVLYGTDNSCWAQYKEQISSLTIDVPAAKNLEDMFEGYYSVKTIKAKMDTIEGSLNRTFQCYSSGKGKGTALTSADLTGMNVSKVTDMGGLFVFCSKLTSVKMGNWDTSNMTDMSFAFSFCFDLESVDVSKWKTSNVRNMRSMFQGCGQLDILDVSKWNTQNLEDTSFLFSGCSKLKKIDVSKWNTSNVTDMENMFQNCRSLTALNLTKFDTSKVVDMNGMFFGCEALENLNIENFDTRNVTDMNRLFGKCINLTKLNLKKFTTFKVTDMRAMFYECNNLSDLDLSSFNTEKVTNVKNMFTNCKKLKKLDLKKFALGGVVNPDRLTGFIDGCESLELFNTPKMITTDASFNTNPKDNRVWYRDDTNTQVSRLPKNLKVSVPMHLQEKENKIVDVRTTGWEYNAVKYVTDKRLMNGVGSTNDTNKYLIFKGNDTLTRGMFVRVLFNRENPKVTTKMTNPFKDVKKTDYFYDAVRWASYKKIVNGTSSKTFSPNDSIKRQDLVVILYNYAKTKGDKYVSVTKGYNIASFNDHMKISNYALTPMKWAACHKIVSGQPIKGSKNYNLNPAGTATRAECAQILMNFENYIKTVK